MVQPLSGSPQDNIRRLNILNLKAPTPGYSNIQNLLSTCWVFRHDPISKTYYICKHSKFYPCPEKAPEIWNILSSEKMKGPWFECSARVKVGTGCACLLTWHWVVGGDRQMRALWTESLNSELQAPWKILSPKSVENDRWRHPIFSSGLCMYLHVYTLPLQMCIHLTHKMKTSKSGL